MKYTASLVCPGVSEARRLRRTSRVCKVAAARSTFEGDTYTPFHLNFIQTLSLSPSLGAADGRIRALATAKFTYVLPLPSPVAFSRGRERKRDRATLIMNNSRRTRLVGVVHVDSYYYVAKRSVRGKPGKFSADVVATSRKAAEPRARARFIRLAAGARAPIYS